MKFTLSWLREHLDTDAGAAQIDSSAAPALIPAPAATSRTHSLPEAGGRETTSLIAAIRPAV